MRRPSVFNQRRNTLSVSMTPMIDVVFLLLVFFIWTSSFQVVEQLLPSQLLQTGGTAAETETDPELIDLERVIVKLTENAGQLRWTINDSPLSNLEAVRGRLEKVAAINIKVPVTIDPQPDIALRHVIDVYDIAHGSGFNNVQFVALQ